MLSGVGDCVGDDARDIVVLERARLATPAAKCTFTAYGCQRLQWVTEVSREGPALTAGTVSALVKVLCVEYYWDDSFQRHGLRVMPVEVPTSPVQVRNRQFFTKAFVRE